MGGAGHFPKRSFKYVYILLLLLTLGQLVMQLGSKSPLGFMTLIAGETNAATGRVFAWALFGTFAFFVFAIYMEMEAFEEKERPFADIQKPKYSFFEGVEWLVRASLVALATVKLWHPQSYQGALEYLAIIAALLLFWSVVATLAFKARWLKTDFALAVLAFTCWYLSWFSSDPKREADFGLGILLALFAIMIILFSIGASRLMDLLGIRPANWPNPDGDETGPPSPAVSAPPPAVAGPASPA
jgi:hypothetical protein